MDKPKVDPPMTPTAVLARLLQNSDDNKLAMDAIRQQMAQTKEDLYGKIKALRQETGNKRTASASGKAGTAVRKLHDSLQGVVGRDVEPKAMFATPVAKNSTASFKDDEGRKEGKKDDDEAAADPAADVAPSQLLKLKAKVSSMDPVANERNALVFDGLASGPRVSLDGPVLQGDLQFSDMVTPLINQRTRKTMDDLTKCSTVDLKSPSQGAGGVVAKPLGRAGALFNAHAMIRRDVSYIKQGGAPISQQHINSAIRLTTFAKALTRVVLAGDGSSTYAWTAIAMGLKHIVNGEETHSPLAGKKKFVADFNKIEEHYFELVAGAWSPEYFPKPTKILDQVPGTDKLFGLFVHQRLAEENALGRRLFRCVRAIKDKKGKGGGQQTALRFLVVHWIIRERYKIACINPNSDITKWLGGSVGSAIDYLLASKVPAKSG